MNSQRIRPRAAPLWAALLLSVLAHAVTLSGSWLHLPRTQPDPKPLLARLEPAPPVTPPAPAAKPAARRDTKRVAAVAAAPPTLKSDVAAPWTEPATDTVADSAAEAPEIVPQPPSPATEPVVAADAAPSTATPQPVVIKTLPRRGRISYDINYYLSNMPTLVGRTVQTWEAADHSYKLDSQSETVGLARFTRFGPRTYRSSGTVTERGLQPQNFSASVMIRGKSDESAAHFDWSSNALQFGSASEQKSAALSAGSQDMLSFMYQLALAPPPRGRMQMSLTNGSRFDRYDVDVFDEETIDTPLGKLRALPVKQVRREGRESVEVWLAADYQYLPVRVLITNRDGTPGGEQVATEISIGDK